MSMTRDEAIKALEQADNYVGIHYINGVEDPYISPYLKEAINIALSALRPVSREQVEKAWRGEWNQDEHGRVVCSRCGSICAIGTKNALHNAKKYDRFCFYCGAPMTNEAVQMVMERLEALHDTEN